jgi:hypothetical protein
LALAGGAGKDVVVVAGGIGLAPLRGVIYHVLSHRKDYGRLAVLYDARSPQDLLYRKELAAWAKEPDTEVRSRIREFGVCWIDMSSERRRKPKIGVFKFASCDGCQLTLLDAEDELLEVADAVDIADFPEATRAMMKGPYDIGLVEGSITTHHDAQRIQEVRRQCKTLVTIGAWATAGGIQALRNWKDVDEFVRLCCNFRRQRAGSLKKTQWRPGRRFSSGGRPNLN